MLYNILHNASFKNDDLLLQKYKSFPIRQNDLFLNFRQPLSFEQRDKLSHTWIWVINDMCILMFP